MMESDYKICAEVLRNRLDSFLEWGRTTERHTDGFQKRSRNNRRYTNCENASGQGNLEGKMERFCLFCGYGSGVRQTKERGSAEDAGRHGN